MCPKCQGGSEKMRISRPHELFDLVGQIREIIAQGTIEFVEGSCSLDEIAPNKPWPVDYIEYYFRCAICHQSFCCMWKLIMALAELGRCLWNRMVSFTAPSNNSFNASGNSIAFIR